MCGLFGIIDKSQEGIKEFEIQLFAALGTASMLRGTHGSGVVFANAETQTAYKSSDPFYVLWNNKELSTAYNEIFIKSKSPLRCLMGHTRHKTTGTRDINSAHPFTTDNIILMHNGTISGYEKFKWEFPVNDFISDSHAFTLLIDKYGLNETLNKVRGSFAVTILDKTNRNILFARNSERPLYYYENQFYFIWASELDMLKWILNRGDTPYYLGKKKGQYRELSPNKLLTISLVTFEKRIEDLKYTPPKDPLEEWKRNWESWITRKSIPRVEQRVENNTNVPIIVRPNTVSEYEKKVGKFFKTNKLNNVSVGESVVFKVNNYEETTNKETVLLIGRSVSPTIEGSQIRAYTKMFSPNEKYYMGTIQSILVSKSIQNDNIFWVKNAKPVHHETKQK